MGRLSRWEGRLFGIFVRGKAAAGQIVRKTISADSARRIPWLAGSRAARRAGAAQRRRRGAACGRLQKPPEGWFALRAASGSGTDVWRRLPENRPPVRGQTISSSMASMRRRRLYLAVRSLRQGAPVLIWPQAVATARSAMVVSSVSPLRWLRMAP